MPNAKLSGGATGHAENCRARSPSAGVTGYI